MPHGALSPRFFYILLDGLAGRVLGYFSFFSGDYDTFCGMDTPFTRWIFLMVFGFRFSVSAPAVVRSPVPAIFCRLGQWGETAVVRWMRERLEKHLAIDDFPDLFCGWAGIMVQA